MEAQLRGLQGERQRGEGLAQRCAELEAENDELAAVARELEAQDATGPSLEAIQAMSLEQLAEAELVHQEALAAIAQRKRVLLEEMARKNGCSNCGRQRVKSTVLFPCRHVVCAGCGAAVPKCPECQGIIQQRFDLPENVHV